MNMKSKGNSVSITWYCMMMNYSSIGKKLFADLIPDIHQKEYVFWPP